MGKVEETQIRLDEVISEIKGVRRVLVEKLRSYYISSRNGKIEVAQLCKNKYSRQCRVRAVSEEFLYKIKNLTMVFNEFKIVGPGVIEFGSRERGNFHLIKLGDKDYFRNCIWIHLSQVREIINDLRFSSQCEIKEFSKYEALICEYKRLSYELYW